MALIATTDATDGPRTQERHEKQRKLQELAQWYREFAERAGNPVIWEARLRTAKELEQAANRLEEESARQRETGSKFPVIKNTAKSTNSLERLPNRTASCSSNQRLAPKFP